MCAVITPTLYFGLNSDLSFYSSDDQAGRAAIVVLAHNSTYSIIQSLCLKLSSNYKFLQGSQTDIVLLVPLGNTYLSQEDIQNNYDKGEWLGVRIVTYPENAVTLPDYDQHDISIYIVSRAQHVVYMDNSWGIEDGVDQIVTIVSSLCTSSSGCNPAPVLGVPLLLGRDFCSLLIESFENSPHSTGSIASIGPDGSPVLRIDDKKKHRSDFLLPASSKLSEALTGILSARCIPEIKKSFQFDPENIDRILLARYDDTGGYFRRHRDNNAPQTAFRKFALSVNLNNDFEGGELLFPEYNDQPYKAPAGSGVIFSASALHEASPVTKGRRYCLLTFFA